MCRRKTACSELAADAQLWDPHCPLRPPSWVSDAVDEFVSAVDCLLWEGRSRFDERMSSIRDSKITDWYIEHGQMSGWHRSRMLATVAPVPIPLADRHGRRQPRSLMETVFQRDSYRCRYCGNKLISQQVIRTVIKIVDSDQFRKGPSNRHTHGIIHATWPVADHVIPWNIGGPTDMSNLVSSCGACNYGKANYTCEQLGLQDPFDRAVLSDGWYGLLDRSASLHGLLRPPVTPEKRKPAPEAQAEVVPQS